MCRRAGPPARLSSAFVSRWGEGINPFATLTLQNFRDLAGHPNLVDGIINTFLLATVGAAASVAVYALVALVTHRWRSRFVAMVDYLVLLPRSLPGWSLGSPSSGSFCSCLISAYCAAPSSGFGSPTASCGSLLGCG